MKIVFVSNYLNHHQLPLCKAFLRMPDVEFTFVATEAVSEERRKFGYVDMDSLYDFVIVAYKDAGEAERAQQAIDSADVVLMGVDPRAYIRKQDQMVFLYSERFLRKKKHTLAYYMDVLRSIKNHTLRQGKNYYVLCAGAYVAGDFRTVGAYRNKMYKWGYFPELGAKPEPTCGAGAADEPVRFLWVGRFLSLKQPEHALALMKALRNKGRNVHLDMIGSGEIEAEIRDRIEQDGLQGLVTMHGSMSPEQVREFMDQADVFLFTSNWEEGWGAVLNEAMNSRCAVIANHWIGAVPYLIQNGENGLIYNDTTEDLITQAERLLDDKDFCRSISEAAYQTIATLWNADVAASHFVELVKRLKAGETCCRDMEGPCGFAG